MCIHNFKFNFYLIFKSSHIFQLLHHFFIIVGLTKYQTTYDIYVTYLSIKTGLTKIAEQLNQTQLTLKKKKPEMITLQIQQLLTDVLESIYSLPTNN